MRNLHAPTRAGLLALALAFMAPLAAFAEEAPEKKTKPVPPAVLKEFDKDGDGSLNEEEKAAWKAAQMAERKAKLEKYDTDKDGKLSEEERAAMKADLSQRKKDKKEKKEKPE
jgi:Ca2+-binding EF-hand superfamily protein